MMRNLDLQVGVGAGSAEVGVEKKLDRPAVELKPAVCMAAFNRVNGVLAEDFLGELSRYYEQAGWADVMGDFIFPEELAAAVIESEGLFAEWEDRKGVLRPGLPLFKLVSSILYTKLLERLEGMDVDVDYMDALRCIILIGESSMAMDQPVAPVVSQIFGRIGRIIEESEDAGASALYTRAVAKLPASITSDSSVDSADRVVQTVRPLLETLSPQQILKVQRVAERNGLHAIALVLAQSFLMKVSGANIQLPLEFDDEAAKEILLKLTPLDDALRKERPNLYPEYATDIDDEVASLLGAIGEIIEDETSLKRAIASARKLVAAQVTEVMDEEEGIEALGIDPVPVEAFREVDEGTADLQPVDSKSGASVELGGDQLFVEVPETVAPPVAEAPVAPATPFQPIQRVVRPRVEARPAISAPAEFPRNFRDVTRQLIRVCPEQKLQDYYFRADEAQNYVWMIRFLEELLRHDPTPGRRLLYAQALSDDRRYEEAHIVATALAHTLGNSPEFSATADDNRKFIVELTPRIAAKNEKPVSPVDSHIQLPELDEKLASVDLPEGFEAMGYGQLRGLSVVAYNAGNVGLNVVIQRRMIELAPESSSTRYFYGLALERFGFDELALEQFQMCDELETNRTDPLSDERRREANLIKAIHRVSQRLEMLNPMNQQPAKVDLVAEDLAHFQDTPFFVFIKSLAVVMKEWKSESGSGLNVVRKVPLDIVSLIETALEHYESDELKKYSAERFSRFTQARDALKAEVATGLVNEKSVLKVLQNRFWK